MFNNIPEMIDYIERLKNEVEKQIESKKKSLNNKCECCKEKNIEIVYKANNFTEEYIDDNKLIYKINANFFCESCYKHIIETGQLEKSQFMTEIDEKYLLV